MKQSRLTKEQLAYKAAIAAIQTQIDKGSCSFATYKRDAAGKVCDYQEIDWIVARDILVALAAGKIYSPDNY